jgi:hypothetical protein
MRLLTILALSAFSLIAADATGKWTGSLMPDDGSTGPALLILKQDGNKLTGTAGPDADKRMEIVNGKVDGDSITFELPGERMKFVLKQNGDSIDGEVSREREGETQKARLVVKREK